MKKIIPIIIISLSLVSCGSHSFIVDKVTNVTSTVDSIGNVKTFADFVYQGREITVPVYDPYAGVVLLVAKEKGLLDKVVAQGFYEGDNEIYIQGAGLKMK